MNFKKLVLLVWKSYRLRAYHKISTLLEIAIPSLIAFYLGLYFFPGFSTAESYAEVIPRPLQRFEVVNGTPDAYKCDQRFVYTPYNKFTDRLMNNVSGVLGNVVEHTTTEAELENYIKVTTPGGIIGVVFQDLQSDDTPQILKYVLRSFDDGWHTRTLYHSTTYMQELRNKSFPGSDIYIQKCLIPLQITINEEFIKMKTNATNITRKLLFQAFPEPAYREKQNTVTLIELIAVVTVLISSFTLISDVIEEKNSGVKELMKITGLEEWIILIGWFAHAMMISMIALTVLMIVLKIMIVTSAHAALYPILWIITVLYCIANVPFCLMFCAIFHSVAVASSVFFLTILVLIFCFTYFQEQTIGSWLKLFCIFPIVAFGHIFTRIAYFDRLDLFSLSVLTMSQNNGISVSAMFGIFMLVFDTFFYLFLTIYINAINPGHFGMRKSPLYIFAKFLPLPSEDEIPISQYEEQVDSKYIEPPPANREVTIKIADLHKRFGTTYAVNGINLNIYDGEITALLGHNGAGKTTTLSILTGSLSASSGSIYYKNENLFEDIDSFRESLGLCPQENRLLPQFSVIDHLLFFGMLKGMSHEEAANEAMYYLTMMEMRAKRSAWVTQLSGGMKRKLCLSISLMGQPSTLILDEPTSGMDVQTRRKIWDLLLAVRGSRTIILTTHHMEEAGALGDRFTIMHQGRIVCHGTPLFLKKAYGTGYELTISKNGEDSNDITAVIQNVLPNATKEYESSQQVIYKLPYEDTGDYPILFANLEANQSRLGITNMGMEYTTVEDVFLKAGNVSVKDLGESPNLEGEDLPESSGVRTSEDAKPEPMTGISLAALQLAALFVKKLLYTRRNLGAFFTRIIFPTVIILMIAKIVEAVSFALEPPIRLSLHTYPGPAVMLPNAFSKDPLYPLYEVFVEEYGGYIIQAVDSNMTQELLRVASQNMLAYRQNLLMATNWNASHVTLMYNLWERHALPIAVNTYYNILLRMLTNSNTFQIQATNFPVGKEKGACYEVTSGAILLSESIVYFMLAYYTVDLIGYVTVFLNAERISGFKHIQLMSNLSPFTYWFGTFVFDLVFLLAIVVLRALLLKIFDDRHSILTLDEDFRALVVLIILFAISGLLFVYLISLLSSSKDATYTIIFSLNVVGTAAAFAYRMANCDSSNPVDGCSSNIYIAMKYVILLTPPFNYAAYFIYFMNTRITNVLCKVCPEHSIPCKKVSPWEYASVENPYAMALGLQFLLIDALLYGGLLMLINTEIFNYLWSEAIKSMFGTYSTRGKSGGDDDVQKEYNYVQEVKEDDAKMSQVSLLVDGLRKNYLRYFKPFSGVSEVSFVVEQGGCFGLLGVNGAGKTTTFKMLTAELAPTLGDAAIQGFKLSSSKKRYLSMIGYCPQTNCFIEELTGRETLTLITRLEGYRGNDRAFVVDKWLSLLGLDKYQNYACGNYSGGNKRKLCTAMSLLGEPNLVFLDEPTSGVDPVSKRKLYDILGQSKQFGQAVVLTSHSMEECEILCDRLTIMVSGVMKCIGSPQHLKARYAPGYTVMIKFHDVPTSFDEIDRLKDELMDIFSPENAILKDEHKGLIFYRITDITLPWSVMFQRMELIKIHHSTILDEYVITDTALEEVFLSFASHEIKTTDVRDQEEEQEEVSGEESEDELGIEGPVEEEEVE